jgi:hypothetical protein
MLDELLEDFWTWWADVKDQFRDAIATELATDIPDEITQRLKALHPDLTWQITPGITARHSLNVASGGSRMLRLISGRWALGAPPADADWEYHPGRMPFDPDVISVRGIDVDPADLRLAIEIDTLFERLNFTVSHEAFAQLDYEESRDVTLDWLDAVLGEDEVERWLGMLEVVDYVNDAVGLDAILLKLMEAKEAFTGQSWEDGAEYYDDDVHAKINRSAKWINNLGRPLYAEVTMASLASDDRGLPTPLEARRLDEISRQLLDGLGEYAAMVATATGDSERTLYLYLAPAEKVDEALAAWKEANGNRETNVEIAVDEQWANAEQWD